jgi:late competence protein required for DNA uptake (superfamily II DNA/RNA helicase)
MALPDNLTTEQLVKHGFKVVSENQAKHVRYNSDRHKCDGCGRWAKQLLGGRSGKIYCDKCITSGHYLEVERTFGFH